MRNFQLIASGIDVAPALNSIMRIPYLWNQNDLRTKYPGTPHHSVDDIWLRFNDVTKVATEQIPDDHESINYSAFFQLPQITRMIFALMTSVNGERLGRCIITRLPPGARIDPHEDGGEHAAYYDRYQLVLQSDPGNIFVCGEEQISMRPGEIWWFNNKLIHEVINNGASDRIVVIIDIRTTR